MSAEKNDGYHPDRRWGLQAGHGGSERERSKAFREAFLWRRDSPNIILWTTTASRKAARGIAASTL
jgi:hypothetical protein